MVVQILARRTESSWGGSGRGKFLKEGASKMKTDMYKICTVCAICRHTLLLYVSLRTQTLNHYSHICLHTLQAHSIHTTHPGHILYLLFCEVTSALRVLATAVMAAFSSDSCKEGMANGREAITLPSLHPKEKGKQTTHLKITLLTCHPSPNKGHRPS